ncbi:MAG: alpha/beta fold hydrolase [Acidimicrobiia bacterium]
MTTLTVDGVDLFFEDLGEGDPVLVIHGAAAAGRWFGDLPTRIAEHTRVILPDLRGLGRSARVAPLERPNIWVEDLWRLLDSLELEQVDVIGCSLGSRIAGRLVLENRSRVRSLVVDAPIIGISAQGNAALAGTFGQVEEDSEQAKEWRVLHGEDWREVVAFYGATRSSPGFQEYFTLRDSLDQIDVPTLICRGDWDDNIHPVDDALIWHKKAPNTQLWIAPGLTQSSTMLERPAEFLGNVRAFHAALSRSTVT